MATVLEMLLGVWRAHISMFELLVVAPLLPQLPQTLVRAVPPHVMLLTVVFTVSIETPTSSQVPLLPRPVRFSEMLPFELPAAALWALLEASRDTVWLVTVLAAVRLEMAAKGAVMAPLLLMGIRYRFTPPPPPPDEPPVFPTTQRSPAVPFVEL
jgi:hypothetical protein